MLIKREGCAFTGFINAVIITVIMWVLVLTPYFLLRA